MRAVSDESLNRNVVLLYAARLCGNLIFFIPVIVIFFQRQGLSMTQVMVLQTAFALAVVGLEIPSGFFADRVGRRPSIFLGAAAVTAACVVYGTGYGFGQFLIAELLWAVGASLISGADSAILYDTLLALGREKEYQKIEGHASFLGLSGAAAAAAAGRLLGDAVEVRLGAEEQGAAGGGGGGHHVAVELVDGELLELPGGGDDGGGVVRAGRTHRIGPTATGSPPRVHGPTGGSSVRECTRRCVGHRRRASVKRHGLTGRRLLAIR